MSRPSSTSVFNEINAATCAALCLISLESLFMDCKRINYIYQATIIIQLHLLIMDLYNLVTNSN